MSCCANWVPVPCVCSPCSVCDQSCLTLCRFTDCSVHGILQARILEWVATSFSRGSSWPRDQTHISCASCIGRVFFLLLRHLENSPTSRHNSEVQTTILTCCLLLPFIYFTSQVNYDLDNIGKKNMDWQRNEWIKYWSKKRKKRHWGVFWPTSIRFFRICAVLARVQKIAQPVYYVLKDFPFVLCFD